MFLSVCEWVETVERKRHCPLPFLLSCESSMATKKAQSEKNDLL